MRIALFLTVVLAACSSEDPQDAVIDGAMVYGTPLTDGNTFACTHCHALEEPAEDNMLRAGHHIGGAPRRTSYKDGKLTSMLDAVNTCVTEWMGAPALAADDARFIALQTWLDAQAPAGSVDNVAISIAPAPADLTGGDAGRGKALFNQSCALCHGMDGGGTERAPSIAGRALDDAYIARRIRTSGLETSPTYDGLTGGRMPFWGTDRLSDSQLKDLVRFVNTSSAAPMMNNMEPNTGNTRNCPTTHAKIGQVATFATRFHGVRGTAHIVDDCTIELRNFGYDGTGIEVRLYGGNGNSYTIPIGPDLLKRGGYSDETFRVQLDPANSLDQFAAVSIWCVAARISFGDGAFQ